MDKKEATSRAVRSANEAVSNLRADCSRDRGLAGIGAGELADAFERQFWAYIESYATVRRKALDDSIQAQSQRRTENDSPIGLDGRPRAVPHC